MEVPHHDLHLRCLFPSQIILQTPGAPLLGRPVTPTTIIKQGSSVQTTVTATTTLQRPPVLQVMISQTVSVVKKKKKKIMSPVQLMGNSLTIG